MDARIFMEHYNGIDISNLLIKIVASKHSGGWDNNFTEYDYNAQLNKPT